MICLDNDILDKSTMRAIKMCITGMRTEEITSEYMIDQESGDMKLVKQKKIEKRIPPNPDLIKLIYQKVSNNVCNYDELSDEELEQEKRRLLKELKEEEDASGESENSN